MFKKSIVLALALLTAIGCTSVSAQDANPTNPSRKVIITNGTPDIIAGIFARISGTDQWAGNILENNVLPPEAPFGIDFSNEENACKFDIKLFIMTPDRVRELNLSEFDVCNNDTLKIIKKSATPEGHPPVGNTPPRDPLAPPVKQYDI